MITIICVTLLTYVWKDSYIWTLIKQLLIKYQIFTKFYCPKFHKNCNFLQIIETF